MYIPKSFRVENRDMLFSLMEEFNFATLVTIEKGIPVATHMPFLVMPDCGEQGKLLGHMAKANPQWQSFGDQEVLVIFQGPHAYISPLWYTVHPSVPTWNYAVVHAYGIPKVIADDEVIHQLMQTMVNRHEASFKKPWKMDLPEDYMQGIIRGTISFEICLTRIEGNFKLSQNRSIEDRIGIIKAIEHSEDPKAREVAQMMRRCL